MALRDRRIIAFGLMLTVTFILMPLSVNCIGRESFVSNERVEHFNRIGRQLGVMCLFFEVIAALLFGTGQRAGRLSTPIKIILLHGIFLVTPFIISVELIPFNGVWWGRVADRLFG